MAGLTDSDKDRINKTFNYGAENYSKDDLDDVLDDEKTALKKGKKLGDFFEEFQLLWSLLKSYSKGEYTNVPWKLIAAIGFAMTYLVSPLDVIPDFIPVLGYVDDLSVFGLVLAAFKVDIDAYKNWINNK